MRTANPLQRLHDYGQSVWLDYISRRLLDEGELRRLVHAAEVWGVTANPAIFERAIAGSSEYDDRLRTLVVAGQSGSEIYESLVGQDIQQAADILRPVYEQTEGADGYVSIEVSPALAHDTAGTIQEAKKFHQAIARPNILIKVPATPEGLPAITSLIADGISVNVTLIFGLERYQSVMDAYLEGLEKAQENGEDLSRIHSVASFFVSRVDSEIDKRLDEIGGHDDLKGKAGIANARLAYEAYEKFFTGERWEKLAEAGANRQRPLWASTGVKNPDYDDTMYVVDLAVANTVNTMPEKTMQAVKDHGEVKGDQVTPYYDDARQVMASLKDAGVDYDDVISTLEEEGVEKFVKSWQELLNTVEENLEAARQ